MYKDQAYKNTLPTWKILLKILIQAENCLSRNWSKKKIKKENLNKTHYLKTLSSKFLKKNIILLKMKGSRSIRYWIKKY